MEITKFLDKENINRKDIICFINEVFEEQTQAEGINNLKLKISNNYEKLEGGIGVDKNLQSCYMVVNLRKILKFRKENKDQLMKIYKTIIHEMEHAKTLIKTKDNDFYDYSHLQVLMECLEYIPSLNFPKKEINAHLFDRFIYNKKSSINYACSTAELKSELEASKKTLEAFSDYLSSQEIENEKKVINNNQIMNDTMELQYDKFRNPGNKFALSVQQLGKIIPKNLFLLDQFPMLKSIFDDQGNIKKLYDIYQSTMKDNKEMNDQIITHMLFSIRPECMDLGNSLKDPQFKMDVENLIGNYDRKVIEFYKRKKDLENFVDSPKIISDNFEIIKMNSNNLNSIINQYSLKRTSGHIVDLSIRCDYPLLKRTKKTK